MNYTAKKPKNKTLEQPDFFPVDQVAYPFPRGDGRHQPTTISGWAVRRFKNARRRQATPPENIHPGTDRPHDGKCKVGDGQIRHAFPMPRPLKFVSKTLKQAYD
ncbi:hypothetical protein NMCA_29960 [Enterobacter ludwigii]|nr:hypothetical protein NMCA_29960 [Enterobacter ludwigii]